MVDLKLLLRAPLGVLVAVDHAPMLVVQVHLVKVMLVVLVVMLQARIVPAVVVGLVELD